jgi:hypothetical protein
VADDGLTLYFFSNELTGSQNHDIWVARREHLDEEFSDVEPPAACW